jgi:3-phenylpropionate/cinnamic acid dioxygenase small subunit
VSKATIEQFLHAQAKAWNEADKDAFFGAFRAVAPGGLQIEYVGRPATDGWPVLEAMWALQNVKIQIEEVVAIVNGNEAACHNRNWVRGTDHRIETIELYRFDSGRLQLRFFVSQS